MKKIFLALFVILLSACTLGAATTPKQKVSEFLDKYKFTHLLLNSGDIMFKLSEIDGYKLIYLDKEYEYKLYVREDLIKTDTPEIKELYIRI